MPAITLTIKDETATGTVTNEVQVSLASELTTVKDLIEARVRAEVAAYNHKEPEYYRGLVQPSDAEATLNGYKLKERRKLDAGQQCRVALEAFERNGYFVLIDNIQATTPDQMVVVNPNTAVSFIKLTPLVGG
jgi:hypothetical protein